MRKTLILVVLFLSVSLQAQQRLSPTANNTPGPFFGLHVHHLASTPWPAVAFGSLRLWDTGTDWASLEPQPGKWDFKNLDADINAAEAHHVQVLLTLGMTPAWASSKPSEKSSYGPGKAAPPKNVEDWKTYVRTISTRYKGRIHYYEIWNEPNLADFYTGTPQQLVQLTEEAQAILKEVDATNRIVSPSATGPGGVLWLREFLKSGGGRYVDIVGFHVYVTPNPPEDMVALTRQVWGVMSEFGIRDHELWDTESGWRIANRNTEVKPTAATGFGSKVLTVDEASAYVARTYILLWGSQVSRFFWYAWDDGAMGLMEADGKTSKPPAIAYAQVEKWLGGARITTCGSDNANTWTCQISRNDYVGHIMWNPDRTIRFPVPRSWGASQLRDLAGGQRGITAGSSVEVGPSPMLLDN